MPYSWEAKGHAAKILRFDETTCLCPMNETETNSLIFALKKQIDQLEASGDFPERSEYKNLLDNLLTVSFVLSTKADATF